MLPIAWPTTGGAGFLAPCTHESEDHKTVEDYRVSWLSACCDSSSAIYVNNEVTVIHTASRIPRIPSIHDILTMILTCAGAG